MLYIIKKMIRVSEDPEVPELNFGGQDNLFINKGLNTKPLTQFLWDERVSASFLRK